MNAKDYKAKKYWEKRLKNQFCLKGVGHISFSESYNKHLYLLKKLALDRVLDIYSIKIKNKSILDIGCGTGFFLGYYKKSTKKIMGIDITKISISKLKEKYPNYNFQVMDISNPNLYFKKTFDIINAFDIFYHITDDKKFEDAVRNISKSCKKEGYVLITDVFWKKDLILAKHVKFRSLQKYEEVLSKNSIEILKIFPIYYLLNRSFHLPFSLSNRLCPIFYLIDKHLQGTKILNGKNMKLLIGKKK